MAQRLPTERYPAVGRCIYCQAERYDTTRRMLSEEHIVPFALNGNLVLPEAVCRKCQKITHQPEESLLLQSAKAYRAQTGYQSRKKHPRELPLFDVNGTGQKVMVPIEDYPRTLGLFFWPLPRLLSGRDPSHMHPMDKLWIDLDQQAEIEKRLNERGIYTWRGYDIKNEMIFGLISKIAHAYTALEFSLDGFQPFLLDYILRQEGDIQYLVGGTEEPERETDMPYRLGHEIQNVGRTRCIVVTVQVLADRLAPTFLAVSGSIPI
jgi:hypothetical protein